MKINSNFRNLSITIFLVISSLSISAQCPNPTPISGPKYIFLDGSASGTGIYNVTFSGAKNIIWSSNISNAWDVTTYDDNSCGISIDQINPDYKVTNCEIKLTADFDNASGSCHYTESIEVVVLPYIAAPTTCIYPGELFNIFLADKCNGLPPSAGCSYAYSWNENPGSFIINGNTNNSCQLLLPTVPSQIPGTISVGCTISCPSLFAPQTSIALTPLSMNVCLHTPTITGPNCVGCTGCSVLTGNIILTASTVGGAFYIWNIVSNSCMQVLSSTYGPSTLILNANSGGTFIVNVTAYSASSNGASSLTSANFTITSCCPSNVPATTNVVSPNTDQKQAAEGIDATNIINSGATAEYHAGGYVNLKPGFSAKFGSYFHAYLASCTNPGIYYRTTNETDPNDNVLPAGSTQNMQMAKPPITNNMAAFDKFQKGNSISVSPNPTTGNVTMRVSRSQNMVIYLQDLTGTLLLQQKMVAVMNSDQNQLNLSEVKDGMYILKMTDEKGNVLKTEKIVIQR